MASQQSGVMVLISPYSKYNFGWEDPEKFKFSGVAKKILDSSLDFDIGINISIQPQEDYSHLYIRLNIDQPKTYLENTINKIWYLLYAKINDAESVIDYDDKKYIELKPNYVKKPDLSQYINDDIFFSNKNKKLKNKKKIKNQKKLMHKKPLPQHPKQQDIVGEFIDEIYDEYRDYIDDCYDTCEDCQDSLENICDKHLNNYYSEYFYIYDDDYYDNNY